MNSSNYILKKIKQTVTGIVPDATVMLFGSRATGNIHEESDWDILVLTKEKHDKKLKWKVHDQLYPIALANNTFIHLTLVSEYEWQNGPSYYSLRLNISGEMVGL